MVCAENIITLHVPRKVEESEGDKERERSVPDRQERGLNLLCVCACVRTNLSVKNSAKKLCSEINT